MPQPRDRRAHAVARLVATLLVGAACGHAPGPLAPGARPAASALPAAPTPQAPPGALERARNALARGDLEQAAGATLPGDAPATDRRELRALRARALRRLGRDEEAVAALLPAREDAEDHRGRLVLAELLLETGRRPEGEAVLRGLIDEYNAGRIPAGDGAHLASVGRAAWLLGSARDANDALEEAEAAGADDDFTRLARAEVFLETHDPGHAGEVLEELLARHPASAEGLARMAEVRIAANLDLDEAARLARRALESDPRLGRARAVLAGLALRDQDFAAADREIALGLAGEPGHLELLSLRATRCFLADDRAGFREARRAVLARDPRYSRLYRILGEHLDWAHRYEEAVELLREALLVAPDDARVRAELGIQLIRGGEEREGVQALARAFSTDPFNVRAWNTLRLYEKHVPASYETREHGIFRIRYSKGEAPLLDRHVPGWLAAASRALTRRYDFVPSAPIGVELYPEREHFAVRTSGLPTTAIQGVCFGRTLAAMSPRDERFNLGMTLWHELSHVYHLQLSRSRVPRWFTEGLAEYETLVARPEWARELDRELDRALSEGRVPGLLDLNRAFSRAEDVADMATAYYASTHVVAHLAERHGMPALRRMLVAWSEGKSTREVLESSLGRPAEELDREVRGALEARVARYRGQYRPPPRPRAADVLAAELRSRPDDPDLLTERAALRLAEGDGPGAAADLTRVLARRPGDAHALYLRARELAGKQDAAGARAALDALLATGADSAELRELRASLLPPGPAREAELAAAHRLDPTRAAPLRELARSARDAGDARAEREALSALVSLEENDGALHRRLLSLQLAAGALPDALGTAQAAVYADVASAETHRLVAAVHLARGDRRAGREALESALLGLGSAEELASAEDALAELLDREGQRARAKALRESAAARRQTAPPVTH